MSTFPSIGGTTYAPTSTPTARLSGHDVAAREFGAAGAAAAVGVGALTDSASATLSVSEEAMEQLAQFASNAGDTAEAAWDAVAGAGQDLAQALSDTYEAVEAPVSAAVSQVADGISAVGDGLADAADAAIGYVSLAWSALR